MDRTGLTGFGEDADAWIAAVGARVPSYVRILEELRPLLGGGPVRDALQAAWAGRIFPASYDRPLLLFAALRAEALRAGPAHPLWAAIAADPPRPEAVTAVALGAALSPAALKSLRERAVQTNETSRAVGWLWPAHLLGADQGRVPLALFDVGTSAGLNLVGDRLAAPWTDDAGGPLPVAREPSLVARVGLDARPLDVRDDEAVAWLEACVWPGESARLARLRAAIAAMRVELAGTAPPVLEAADAHAFPARIAEHARGLPVDALLLVFQSVFIDYLPPPTRTAYEAGMTALLASRPRAVWLELEPDAAADRALPAVLRARFSDGGTVRQVPIARTGYHPTVVRPLPAGVFALTAALSR